MTGNKKSASFYLAITIFRMIVIALFLGGMKWGNLLEKECVYCNCRIEKNNKDSQE